MRPWVYGLLLAVGLLAAGCVDFEWQSMTFHHDQDADELRIIQVYHGIFGADGGETLSEREEEQLLSVFSRQRTFFFANWIFEYDEERLGEMLPSPGGDEGEMEPPVQAAARLRRSQLETTLAESVSVVNGGFFIAEDGKLGGWQYVRLANLSAIIELANQYTNSLITSDLVMDEIADVDAGEAEADKAAMLKRAAVAGHRWVGVDGNRLWFRMPLAAAEFHAFKFEQAQYLRGKLEKAGKLDEKDLRLVLAMLENPVWVNYADNMMEVVCGRREAVPVTVRARCADGYTGNAIEFASSRFGLQEVPDWDKLRGDFLIGGEPQNQAP